MLPVSADYTDKDFESVRRRLYALIASVFPTWTDSSVANFGNLLLEMFAWTQDVLGFYQDNQAIESRITTAAQRKNLLALAKLVNYEPSTAIAAQTLVRFTGSPAPVGGDTVVLGGSTNPFPIVVETGEGDAVQFELQDTVTLTAANASAGVWGTVENSETHSEVFASEGLLGQEITLSRTPYLGGSAAITADNGGYSEVASFLNSSATDRHFTVHTSNADAAIIRFGNMVSGQLPSGSILVTYKTGGGSVGNVEANAIIKINGSFQTENGTAITISVLNESVAATGGADRETEAQIRENAPLSLRVLTRAVCRDDFEILAIKVGGMARALMLTNSEDSNLPVNTGFFYLVPEAARGQQVGFATPAKMDEVLRRIKTDYPWPTSFAVVLRPPTFVDVSIRAIIYLKKGYSEAQVAAQVIEAYRDYFALYNTDGTTNHRVDFGYRYTTGAADEAKVLPLSDLENCLRDCVGIHRLGVYAEDFTVGATTDNNTGVIATRVAAGSHVDIPLEKFEFPRFVSVTLINGATGAQFHSGGYT